METEQTSEWNSSRNDICSYFLTKNSREYKFASIPHAYFNSFNRYLARPLCAKDRGNKGRIGFLSAKISSSQRGGGGTIVTGNVKTTC